MDKIKELYDKHQSATQVAIEAGRAFRDTQDLNHKEDQEYWEEIKIEAWEDLLTELNSRFKSDERNNFILIDGEAYILIFDLETLTAVDIYKIHYLQES